jgi:hypothetical protein
MKKLLLILFILLIAIISFSWNALASSDCDYGGDILWSLEKCFNDSELVGGNQNDAKISEWFSTTVKNWTNNIALFLAVFAVLWIAYGSFNLVISQWESEKATKAKNMIQWSIIWFICVITASLIINLVIRIMYSI